MSRFVGLLLGGGFVFLGGCGGYDCAEESLAVDVNLGVSDVVSRVGDWASTSGSLEFVARVSGGPYRRHVESVGNNVRDGSTTLRILLDDVPDTGASSVGLELTVRALVPLGSVTRPVAIAHHRAELTPDACNSLEVLLRTDEFICEGECTLSAEEAVLPKVTCGSGSRCFVGAGDPVETVACAYGASCTVACEGDATCPELSCLNGASCAMKCQGRDACAFDCGGNSSQECVVDGGTANVCGGATCGG
ncbi:MAG: hypothetical protein IPK13_25475 [Deltaproteobacteria bacterium]|nr:hypothetical protein [Deltaproteobacteria bacterium]